MRRIVTVRFKRADIAIRLPEDGQFERPIWEMSVEMPTLWVATRHIGEYV